MYHFPVVKVKQHPNLLHKICEENNRLCLTIFINPKQGLSRWSVTPLTLLLLAGQALGIKKKTIDLIPGILQSKRIMISKTKKKTRFEQVHGKP